MAYLKQESLHGDDLLGRLVDALVDFTVSALAQHGHAGVVREFSGAKNDLRLLLSTFDPFDGKARTKGIPLARSLSLIVKWICGDLGTLGQASLLVARILVDSHVP